MAHNIGPAILLFSLLLLHVTQLHWCCFLSWSSVWNVVMVHGPLVGHVQSTVCLLSSFLSSNNVLGLGQPNLQLYSWFQTVDELEQNCLVIRFGTSKFNNYTPESINVLGNRSILAEGSQPTPKSINMINITKCFF